MTKAPTTDQEADFERVVELLERHGQTDAAWRAMTAEGIKPATIRHVLRVLERLRRLALQ